MKSQRHRRGTFLAESPASKPRFLGMQSEMRDSFELPTRSHKSSNLCLPPAALSSLITNTAVARITSQYGGHVNISLWCMERATSWRVLLIAIQYVCLNCLHACQLHLKMKLSRRAEDINWHIFGTDGNSAFLHLHLGQKQLFWFTPAGWHPVYSLL